MKRILLLLVVGLLGFGLSAEARGVGTSAANFLKAGLNARASGMGGAFVGMADDLNSVEWNPAGLSRLSPELFHASFQHIFWFADVEYEMITVGQVLSEDSGGAVQVLYRHMQDIDNNIEDEKPIKAYDVVTTIGYGTVVSNFHVGMNLKFIVSHLGTEDMFGEAVDLGLQAFFMERKVCVGVAIQNLGPDINSDSLPLNLRGGAAYREVLGENKEHRINAGLELNQPFDNKLSLLLGAEYWYAEMFAARFGIRQALGSSDLAPDSLVQHLTGGVSVRWADLQLDYAFVPYAALGGTHRLCLSAKYGPLKDEIEK